MNDRAAMFGELNDLLASRRDVRPIYVPNPGNAGDSFIAHATYQLFDRTLSGYDIGSPDGHYPGRTVIFGGGGNFVAMYPDAARFIATNHRDCQTLILLPHTISGHEDVLSELGGNCHIFCRERVSYDHVRSQARRANVYLSHDLALQADLASTRTAARRLHKTAPYIFGLLKRRVRLAMVAAGHRRRTGGGKVLNAFRVDRERAGAIVPSGNFDVSDVYSTRDLSPPAALDTTDMMITLLDRYEQVRTNRLHQCILSALMGKSVAFFPNSYWKNRAVFEHSLEPRFSRVRWCGTDEIGQP
jgi:exopolysaccharide biosynthesis predicted pyruvyltransferase EpsI